MDNLINIPEYLYINLDLNKLTKFQKVRLISKGKIISLLFKLKSEKLFCSVMNIIYKQDGRIYFRDNFYIKKTNDREVFFPSKRISSIFIDYKLHIEKFYKTYCLQKIKFTENDLVVDCGANIGELYLALKEKNHNVKYIGFEPDRASFDSLKRNVDDENIKLYNLALSNKNDKQKLYIDTKGANTSLSPFNTKEIEEAETVTLDSLGFDKIKLLKIDAEGHEPEVLEGLKQTLKNIDYISIDHSNERGINQEETTVEVFNFLFRNNFEVFSTSSIRGVTLFKNLLIEEESTEEIAKDIIAEEPKDSTNEKENITFVFVSGRKNLYEKNLIEARELYYTLPLYDVRDTNINVIEFEKNNSIFTSLLYLLDRFFNKILSLPFYMHLVCKWKNYKTFKASDHVFLVTESTGLSVLPMLIILKIFGKTKVHLFVMGLYSKKLKYGKLKFFHNLTINFLVYFLDTLFFLGKGELEKAKTITKNHEKLHFLPFSVDEDFWTVNNEIDIKKKENIIFVGNDGNRDFELLIQIAQKLPHIQFTFVSNVELINKLNLDNVTVLGTGWGKEELTDEDLKQLYLDSRITILPLKESPQPSGQSVALQSMSLGTPVLISETEGFWDKDQFKDNLHIFFVKENSLDGWVKRINEVYGNFDLLEKVSKNSKNIVNLELNLNKFNKKVRNIIKLG